MILKFGPILIVPCLANKELVKIIAGIIIGGGRKLVGSALPGGDCH